jgi:formylmethanofuran dehydrogenase subunit E
MDLLEALLTQSAEYHRHLCPRQVLGVRMGLYAGELLGLELPQSQAAAHYHGNGWVRRGWGGGGD